MSITAKELAEKLNLSQTAVSMALNNKPGVSTETRRMVVEAAEKYAGNQPVSAGVQFPYPHNTGADPELYTQSETEKNNADRHLCAAFYFHSGSGGHDVRILRSCGRNRNHYPEGIRNE